jgi:hypothetical protein
MLIATNVQGLFSTPDGQFTCARNLFDPNTWLLYWRPQTPKDRPVFFRVRTDDRSQAQVAVDQITHALHCGRSIPWQPYTATVIHNE